ncbi:RNA pyrophosphohydrolase [Ketobacter alkanivorans]|uniref:RNA pyrophosphohydrolase n=1 Tax=Ketobacter alkanivorans TaxID=1917421 RepID=A0A2K9LM37_9GAMM|nr:RNA pyrophosphohydrolase [Ketobacter alkanivorans]AUM13398.1 RNA pyrophosphohydrolase [Ketobacter alkanivorans]MCP5019919.1 RNA pyrophosphohydrolase [Ketobacter sp.]
MIDEDGFRPNVGIILANAHGQVLWARRVGQDAWQFPQGGISVDETPEQALYRELREEIGLKPEDVRIVSSTQGWLRYRLPKRFLRYRSKPLCIGQKQKWFLLMLTGCESQVSFEHGDPPEFDGWRWVSYWYPLNQVVSFKREVYRKALKELAPSLHAIAVEACDSKANAKTIRNQ